MGLSRSNDHDQWRCSFPGCHCTSNSLFRTWSVTQKNCISIDRDRCFLTVAFAIPVAVLLSQCTGVGGWRWPSSLKANHNTLPSLIFKNKAPSSASAAEQTTICSMPHETNMFPFIWMFSPFLGTPPKKKYPASLLRARDSERYDASECMFSTMDDA